MPDIFISKDRREQETKNRVDRIKKLLAKKTTTPVMPEKSKTDSTTDNQADLNQTIPRGDTKEAVEAVKQEGGKNVLARIQKEITDILKDKPDNGFFTTFIGRPHKVRFETQDKDEKILALLRQHWIVNVPWILISIILFLLMLFFKYTPLFPQLPSAYRLVLTLGYFLFIYYYVVERLLKWFFNVYIITDERVIDVDFVSLLYKHISGCKIDKIQDVSYDMSGLVEAFFNFGSVRIQTASEMPTFEFENVPKPQQVVSLLNQLVMEEEVEKLEGRVR